MRKILAVLTLMSVAVVVPWAPGATATHFGSYTVSTAPSAAPLIPLTNPVDPGAQFDDTVTSAFGMPFSIEFFGQPTSLFWVGSNGFLTMFSIDTACTNAACEGDVIPTAGGITTGIVAGFWTDLKPDLGGTIRFDTTQTVAGGPALIVQYQNVPGPTGAGANTFQIVVRSDSVIEVRIASVAAAGGEFATIGLESCEFCGPLAGVQHARSTSLLLSNQIITFTPSGVLPPSPQPDLCLSGNVSGCGPLTATRGTTATNWFLTLRVANVGTTTIDFASIHVTATPLVGPLNGLGSPSTVTACFMGTGSLLPGETRLLTCTWPASTRIGQFDFVATGTVFSPSGDPTGNNVATTTGTYLVSGLGGTTS